MTEFVTCEALKTILSNSLSGNGVHAIANVQLIMCSSLEVIFESLHWQSAVIFNRCQQLDDSGQSRLFIMQLLDSAHLALILLSYSFFSHIQLLIIFNRLMASFSLNVNTLNLNCCPTLIHQLSHADGPWCHVPHRNDLLGRPFPTCSASSVVPSFRVVFLTFCEKHVGWCKIL